MSHAWKCPHKTCSGVVVIINVGGRNRRRCKVCYRYYAPSQLRHPVQEPKP